MTWEQGIRDYINYLRLEKGLSENTLSNYKLDIIRLKAYADNEMKSPLKMETKELSGFMQNLSAEGLSPRTQARILASTKGFFKWMVFEDLRKTNPAELLESPKTGRKLPVYLSIEEIDAILGVIDAGSPEGHRNQAIIETLYGCGMRVSELTQLRMRDLYFNEGFIRVFGKGSKERLVPLNDEVVKKMRLYFEVRNHIEVKKGYEDFVFLSRRGTSLTRAMIFTMIRRAAEKAGIKKIIGPHTFRHSFATHLVQNGADIRAVQDLLGHESITTTEIYTHLEMDHLRNTVEHFHPRIKKFRSKP